MLAKGRTWSSDGKIFPLCSSLASISLHCRITVWSWKIPCAAGNANTAGTCSLVSHMDQSSESSDGIPDSFANS